MLRALGLWAQFQSIQVARERLENLFRIEPETADRTEKVERLSGQIEMTDVAFSYSEGAPIFEGLNLSVQPGEVIGISGGNRLGQDDTAHADHGGASRPAGRDSKSTASDVTKQEPECLRRQIAYLPQTPVLFQGTILENLTMFGDQSMVEDAIAAANLLGLDSEINRLPNGYETMVGDGASEELPNGFANRASSLPAPWSVSRASFSSTKPTPRSTAEAMPPSRRP